MKFKFKRERTLHRHKLSGSLENVVFILSLLLTHHLENPVEVLLEALEDAARVLSSAVVSHEVVKALGQRGVGNGGTLQVVMVDENHAVLRVDAHLLGEEAHELDQVLLGFGCHGVIHEDDAVCVLLDWPVAFFVLQVTAYVPELDVQLAKVSH